MSYGGEATGSPAVQTLCFEMTQYTHEFRRICWADAYQIRAGVGLQQSLEAGREVG